VWVPCAKIAGAPVILEGVAMCEHPIVDLEPRRTDYGTWAAVVWWFRCRACSVEAAYVEYEDSPSRA
jgi:hypothetical protein